MLEHVKISVIIPMFNEEQCIRKAIHSARDADEVIVVDGGSDDESIARAEQANAIIVRSERGRGVQLRTGVNKATGDVLLLLHADSWVADGAINELRCIAAVKGRIHGCFRQQIDDTRWRYRALEFGNQLRATWLRMPYGDQAVFVDRASYEQVGGIDAVPLMEDVMFSRKLRVVGRPQLLDGPVHLSARRWNQRGVLRQTLKNWSILTAYYLGVSPVQLARWYR